MAGKYNKDIAKYEARPADVACLQPLFEAKVDEPGVKPGNVEKEEGGNVAMKEWGTRPVIFVFTIISYFCWGVSEDYEEELDE